MFSEAKIAKQKSGYLRGMKIVSTSNGFVGALDVVRVKVLFARFGLGHESCGA